MLTPTTINVGNGYSESTGEQFLLVIRNGDATNTDQQILRNLRDHWADAWGQTEEIRKHTDVHIFALNSRPFCVTPWPLAFDGSCRWASL